jgi:two-component system response regulator DesR
MKAPTRTTRSPASSPTAAELSEGESPLTEREHDILAATAAGQSIAAIAGSLYLSEGTVRNYLLEAIQKLGARNRVEAARIAEGRAWL